MKIPVAIILSIIPYVSYAGSCDVYPYSQNINVEEASGGIRIIATAAVAVSFDDVDSIKDARDEATLEAKTLISKFMSESIKSDKSIETAIKETKSMQGDTKETNRQSLKTTLKRMSSSSAALLRGVVPLGECYTKGKEFRVSVGIKPETIAAAGVLAGGITTSVRNQPTPNSSNTDTSGTSTSAGGSRPSQTPGQGNSKNTGKQQGVDGYSDTRLLNKF